MTNKQREYLDILCDLLRERGQSVLEIREDMTSKEASEFIKDLRTRVYGPLGSRSQLNWDNLVDLFEEPPH